MAGRAEIIYLAEAEEDFREIARFYTENIGPSFARRLYLRHKTAIASLAVFPLSAPLHPDPELAVKGLPQACA